MALDFGKLAFSVSFNPTSAFPIDARSYFESLTAAQEAAASAKPAGSKDSIYYYGQTLVVVENNLASFYMIQTNGTLVPVGGSGGSGGESVSITVDPKQFEYDIYGNLSLKGFDEAAVNSLLSIGEDGTLSWVAPIDTYTKAEIDTKLSSLVVGDAHMARKIVDTEQDIEDYMNSHDDADKYIFMVPSGLQDESNKYYEYIVVSVEDSEGVKTQYYERVGSWEVNLDDYAKTEDVNAALADKVDAVEGARLITDEEGQKLSDIEDGAQVNIIDSVSEDFSIVTDEPSGIAKQLRLNALSIEKITGLQDALDKKVDSVEGYTLLSPSDKEKLDALILGDNGFEISGNVNAENVIGLEEWINAHQNTVDGLSANNLSDGLYTKLNTSLFIKEVDTTQLKVGGGKLSVVAISPELVTGLTEALESKASASELGELKGTVNAINGRVGTVENNLMTLTNTLNSLSRTVNTHTEDIAELKDALTWKDI